MWNPSGAKANTISRAFLMLVTLSEGRYIVSLFSLGCISRPPPPSFISHSPNAYSNTAAISGNFSHFSFRPRPGHIVFSSFSFLVDIVLSVNWLCWQLAILFLNICDITRITRYFSKLLWTFCLAILVPFVALKAWQRMQRIWYLCNKGFQDLLVPMCINVLQHGFEYTLKTFFQSFLDNRIFIHYIAYGLKIALKVWILHNESLVKQV